MLTPFHIRTELIMKHLKTIVNEDHIEDVDEAMSQGRDFYVENMTVNDN